MTELWYPRISAATWKRSDPKAQRPGSAATRNRSDPKAQRPGSAATKDDVS